MTAHDPVADLVFAPGAWTAVAGPRSWLLVQTSPDDPAVARCWRLIRDAASSDEVLNSLVMTRAAYAFVHRDGDAARAVVRGAAEVALHIADGSLVTIASDADRRVPGGLQGFRLSAREQTGSVEASLPLAVGVVQASAIGTPMPKPKPETTSVGFYTQIIAELPWTKRLLGEHGGDEEAVRVTAPDPQVYESEEYESEDDDAEKTRRRTWSPVLRTAPSPSRQSTVPRSTRTRPRPNRAASADPRFRTGGSAPCPALRSASWCCRPIPSPCAWSATWSWAAVSARPN